ncbi:E3 ubiquitin-protein ligase RHF2A-like isoform X2 [Sesamum indicum]|uniref:RING-type E3 ubiquitin transferase n=1 Tax=Sesamum indicum TaxID=4182 RepID=A0A8M8V041_SESIN|nr:E3 ubiquitin-protein ligase RHF2A-like isoform X2 [Sesamum indicum]
MEEGKVSGNSLTSAAAFVEGGIQDACDDACSICLEAFCDSDPSTVTSCKHEFHLQCILEWCQRSSQCPMCWQPISLKDPSSQELLDAVEHERNLRMNPPTSTTIFHHPTLGDFELQHLPVNASESELEERIIQHLAAAAAMGRARQLARREGQRNRSSTQEDSAQLNAQPSTPQADQLVITQSGSSASANRHGTSTSNRRSPGSQDRAGPSDFQSFSETLKSRLSALSVRYKESITKSTRGWKERLFARNSSTPNTPTAEVRREANQGVATVTRMMDHLDIAEDGTTNTAIVSNNFEDGWTPDPTEHPAVEMGTGPSSDADTTRAPCAASSASS